MAKTTTILFSELYTKPRTGPRLFRCEDCKAMTDDPDGHAAWHATITLAKPGRVAKVEGVGGQRTDPIAEVEVKVDTT